MNFLHLKYLIEVEKYESISKAAQHLYINQPRLSKIIKEIEQKRDKNEEIKIKINYFRKIYKRTLQFIKKVL